MAWRLMAFLFSDSLAGEHGRLFEESFRELDKDEDGYLTIDQLDVYELPSHKARMERVDLDGDGKVSLFCGTHCLFCESFVL